MAGPQRRTKGVFSSGAQLPVAGRYLVPGRRAWLLRAGLIGCAVAAALALGAALVGTNPAAPGPLSSAHATFAGDCAQCHRPFRPFQTASADPCQSCHEKVGDTAGAYSLAAHAALAASIASVSSAPGDAGNQQRPAAAAAPACATCHVEHRGRGAALAAVPDSRCLDCHDVGSFGGGHPEFQFARDRQPDDAHLRFSHLLHLAEVRKARGHTDPQRACLDCHEPDAQGAGFGPIDFARHCDACHLTAGTGTPRLPIGDPADPAAPGVETLVAMMERQGAAVRWAWSTNPDDFQETAGKVAKRPVEHADPWVMENLRRIRRQLSPGLGLAELLATSVDHGSAGAGPAVLTREAVASLREAAAGLRGRPEPEIQAELKALDGLLAAVEKRLARGEAVPASAFTASAAAPGLAPQHAAALRRLALDLTEPCRTCHVVSDAAILRVQSDQRTLLRAQFSHRAHRLLVPKCTDCHGAIPGLGRDVPADEARDLAETQNLPTIAVCRTCHNRQAAADRCVSCHLFHPGGGRHADLLADQPAAREEP